jgi:aspartyl/asparaginyl beta-hydroxylase (cupin superfamily)
MVFDDLYEHEARDRRGADRIVLIVDLWHPELPLLWRDLSAYWSRHAEALAATRKRYS